jgi:hypothetical protein
MFCNKKATQVLFLCQSIPHLIPRLLQIVPGSDGRFGKHQPFVQMAYRDGLPLVYAVMDKSL